MNRRTALKAVGASLLAGTALSTPTVAEQSVSDDPRIVAVESDADAGSADEPSEYTVTYGDDGSIEISGRAVAPTPCYEVVIADIVETEHGDLIDLELAERDDQFCNDVLAAVNYTARLQYESTDDDPEILVSTPDRSA